MKIIILDTYSGLCNQFYDIICGINFGITNNIKFSFRYCSFRHTNLTSWSNVEFNNYLIRHYLKNMKIYMLILKIYT
jgi:hypothetical protein